LGIDRRYVTSRLKMRKMGCRGLWKCKRWNDTVMGIWTVLRASMSVLEGFLLGVCGC